MRKGRLSGAENRRHPSKLNNQRLTGTEIQHKKKDGKWGSKLQAWFSCWAEEQYHRTGTGSLFLTTLSANYLLSVSLLPKWSPRLLTKVGMNSFCLFFIWQSQSQLACDEFKLGKLINSGVSNLLPSNNDNQYLLQFPSNVSTESNGLANLVMFVIINSTYYSSQFSFVCINVLACSHIFISMCLLEFEVIF